MMLKNPNPTMLMSIYPRVGSEVTSVPNLLARYTDTKKKEEKKNIEFTCFTNDKTYFFEDSIPVAVSEKLHSSLDAFQD